MKEIMTPLSLLITALAACLNERNYETIDFLREEVETYQAIAGTGRRVISTRQAEDTQHGPHGQRLTRCRNRAQDSTFLLPFRKASIRERDTQHFRQNDKETQQRRELPILLSQHEQLKNQLVGIDDQSSQQSPLHVVGTATSHVR